MSTTASLLRQVSSFRNPTMHAQSYNFAKIALAQIAYACIVPYAIVEAAISQLIKGIAKCLPIESRKYQSIHVWATSSAYCTAWAIYAMSTNLFTRQMCPSESQFVSTILKRNANLLGSFNPFGASEDSQISAHLSVVDPAVAQLLSHYELGENATKYSDIPNRIYRELPQPTTDELNGIGAKIADLLEDSCTLRHQKSIQGFFDIIAQDVTISAWEERFIKMVICVHKVIMRNNDLPAIEILKQAILDGDAHCSNRKSTEMEHLFYHYAIPDLMNAYVASMSTQDMLTWEMMLFRMKLRDIVINVICNDNHNAASHRFFRDRLNQSVFHLPPPLLCTEDNNYDTYAMKQKENTLINAFRTHNDSPLTVYRILNDVIHPKQGDKFVFTPQMFEQELLLMGIPYDRFFANTERTAYKPQSMIDYLVSAGFLRRKPVSS